MKASQQSDCTPTSSASVFREELPPEGQLELLRLSFARAQLPEAPDHFSILLKALKDIFSLVMAAGILRASLCV